MADPLTIGIALGAVGQAVAVEVAWTVAANYAISTLAFDLILYGTAAAISMAGSAALAPGMGDVEGPRASQNQSQFSTYGKFIDVPYGRTKSAGNIIWTSGIREEKTTTEVGGKGGGGGTVTNYNYYSSWALALCEGKVKEIHKIWFDADLVYSNVGQVQLESVSMTGLTTATSSTQVAVFGITPATEMTAVITADTNGYYRLGTGADFGKVYFTEAGATAWNAARTAWLNYDPEIGGDLPSLYNVSIQFTYQGTTETLNVSIDRYGTNSALFGQPNVARTSASPVPNFTEKLTIYYGDEEQNPNPLMEADKGTGNVPAYRGICYLVFDDFNLGDWGNRIPNILVEFSRFPDSGVTSNIYPLDIDIDGYLPSSQYVDGQLRTVVKSLVVEPDQLLSSVAVDSISTRSVVVNYSINEDQLLSSAQVDAISTKTVVVNYSINEDQLLSSAQVDAISTKTVVINTAQDDQLLSGMSVDSITLTTV